MSILNRARKLFSKPEGKPVAPKKEPTIKNEHDDKTASSFVGDGFDLELDKKRLEYIKENATQVSAPRPKTPEGVAMDSSCASMNHQGSFDYVNRHILSYYVASSSFIGYYAMAVIAQHWLVQVGCSSAAEDAMRHGYQLLKDNGDELEREEARRIAKLDKKYKLDQNIIEGDTFNNVFGIRHILFKHTDENFDYEKPFNADAFKGNKYAGISQIDPYWITPELDNNDITDPTAITYYEPTFWIINGKRYHKSHFVILTGEPVADYLKPTYRYGGISMAQKVYERVYAGERTANEIPQLAMTKRMNVRKTDLAKAQANKQAFIKSLNAAAEFRDNYGEYVIGKEEDFTQLETSLADLDKSMWANYHLVASIFRRPVSKIFGTGHGGFSTGETDEDYDIAMLESLQSGNLEDIAHAHYQRLMMSEFGKEMDLDIVWNPLKIMSDKDIADVNFVKSQTAMNEYNIGAIGDVDERERLSKDKYSGYSGVDVVEDVPPDDEDETEKDDPAIAGSLDPEMSLNGAQVTALTGLVEKVSKGEMSKDTASRIMAASFPMTEDDAKSILSDVTEGSRDNQAMDGYNFDENQCLSEIAEDAYDEEYQGKQVTLNKPFRDADGAKKYGVYVKNEKGNVVKVGFGDPDMEIRRDNEEARKNFRSRHDCENKTDKTKAGYWSCKFWSSKSVSELLS